MTLNRSQNGEESDEFFAERLRELRPVPPRQLSIPRYRARWRMLAIAGIFLLVSAISFLVPHLPQATVPHTGTSSPVTIGTLNAALRDNDETLNRLLDDASPHILARGQTGTVLYELGKE